MKVKTLICNCQTLDPSRYAERVLQAFGIKSESGVSQAGGHAYFCAEEILEDLQRAVEDDSDTYFLVCARKEESQKKLSKKTRFNPGFAVEPSVRLDLRHAASNGILGRIRARLEEFSGPNKSPH